uniref:Uncharacterized protein n=1 Tax=Timema douglasi TaxID=61478 RepID=A0A7R8VV65_TIMDO|nr:unnamed protein product [Timema douglasi]
MSAIETLDSLNERIATSLTSPPEFSSVEQQDGDELVSRQQQAVHSSMALMRRLLVDAQAKFRRMVEENKQLAARIDGDIQNAQEEVAVLRGELTDTSRRLDEHLNTRPSHQMRLLFPFHIERAGFILAGDSESEEVCLSVS